MHPSPATPSERQIGQVTYFEGSGGKTMSSCHGEHYSLKVPRLGCILYHMYHRVDTLGDVDDERVVEAAIMTQS